VFDPARYETFRFVSYDLSADGVVSLRYALDDEVFFTERLQLPGEKPAPEAGGRDALDAVLWLLHLVAGVSYYKTAVPPRIAIETSPLSASVAAFCDRLYRRGLSEFAYRNRIELAERIFFPVGGPERAPVRMPATRRALIPIGGGKDSIVALEMMRTSDRSVTLFSVGDLPPIHATVATAGLPRVLVRRELSPHLSEVNRDGAWNGHVPVTAIVSCIALVVAARHGFDEVVMANERSASEGSLRWQGEEVNHQYSKSLVFERDLRAALGNVIDGITYFSVLRSASELTIARAFARLDRYHQAFTSCNATLRLDEARRAASWCGDCPKCRFVFLVLAPVMERSQLSTIFGRNLLDVPDQYPGFTALAAVGEPKPFECVGEVAETLAAFRLLSADPRWRDAVVVRRFVDEHGALLEHTDPAEVLSLSDDSEIPADLAPLVHAYLSA